MSKENFIINPWEVKGNIDYERLIKKFGLQEFSVLLKELKEDVLFKRGIIFAHRDFNQISDAIKNKKKFVMMTGLMPTGKFHLGHMLLAQQMILYQKLGAKIYIAVADIESYHTRGQSLEESRKIAIEEYITNYIALGLEPKNCEIYFQSQRSNNAIKSNEYYKLQNVFAKNITFNEFKAVYGEITPGKMVSALLQASDMLHTQLKEFEGVCPVIVPVGADQDPHIRLARDIAKRTDIYKFKQISSTYHVFMPGLKGGKMSASDSSSFIALTDLPKDAEKKIKKYAFSGGQPTLEEHRKKGGNPDIDVSFQYLKFFFEEDDKKLQKIYDDYKSGKLLSGELKQILIGKLIPFLEQHQKKRESAKKRLKEFNIKN